MAFEFDVVDIPVQQLTELKNQKNPRWMPEDQKESLKLSLGKFKMVEPVVLNTRTSRVVSGHQRIDAAAEIGAETLPVVLIDVDPDLETALNLGFNVRGEWDYEKLADVLSKIAPENLAVTGFQQEEAANIIAAFAVNDAEIAEEFEDSFARDFENQTEEEVTERFESTIRIQFGMFKADFSPETYGSWVKQLKQESGDRGESPIALGMVVAARLGIESTRLDQEPVAFTGDEGELSEEEETLNYEFDPA